MANIFCCKMSRTQTAKNVSIDQKMGLKSLFKYSACSMGYVLHTLRKKNSFLTVWALLTVLVLQKISVICYELR